MLLQLYQGKIEGTAAGTEAQVTKPKKSFPFYICHLKNQKSEDSSSSIPQKLTNNKKPHTIYFFNMFT